LLLLVRKTVQDVDAGLRFTKGRVASVGILWKVHDWQSAEAARTSLDLRLALALSALMLLVGGRGDRDAPLWRDELLLDVVS
jgi:hypothetical protein